MKKSSAITDLELLAASQWGMFTTAQAQQLGVQRNQISRMVDALRIESVCYGVYRFIAGNEPSFPGLKAAWLSAFPKKTAAARFSEKPYDAVAAGRTAAYALNAGDFQPSPYTFITQQRKQTSRGDMKFLHCRLGEEDIILDAGIPTTSFERTVYDLLRLDEDPDNVDRFIQDAARKKDHVFNQERLAQLLAPIASRYGFRAGDGASFAADLVARNAAPIQMSRALGSLRHTLKSLADRAGTVQTTLADSAAFTELRETLQHIAERTTERNN